MNGVSIQLIGGLGNYMFQIASAYGYALDNNKKVFLSTNNSVTVHKNIDTYLNNVFSNLEFTDQELNDYLVYNEPYFHFCEIPKMDGNVYLSGYFQSEKYFKKHSNEIKKIFSYPEEYVKTIHEKYKGLLSNNLCSIHVRRGDYLNHPNAHPQQTMDYYFSAINKMPEGSKFLVFSDDINWCENNFIGDNFTFIKDTTDYEDLLLMSLCNNNIICNSSFSWWGAWLNNNQDKIVVAPNKWFGPVYGHITNDLYSDTWVKI